MAKIMVVDDSPDIIWVYSKILEVAGHTIITATNGEEALEILDREKPNLILMDIMMPGMDGWEATKKIKENEDTKDITVVMVSVRSDEEDKKKSFEYAHADDHVNKLSSSDIVDVVAKYVTEESSGATEIF